MSRHSDKKRAAEAPAALEGRLGNVRDAMRAADHRFLTDEAAAGRLESGLRDPRTQGHGLRRLTLKLVLLLAIYGAFIEFSWFAYKTQHPGLASRSFAVVELSDRFADWLGGMLLAAPPGRSKT